MVSLERFGHHPSRVYYPLSVTPNKKILSIERIHFMSVEKLECAAGRSTARTPLRRLESAELCHLDILNKKLPLQGVNMSVERLEQCPGALLG